MRRVCSQCNAINRIPARYLSATGKCGKCRAQLPPHATPIEVASASEFDEIVGLELWDVVRVAPKVVRGFEGGPEGLTLIAVGSDRPEGGDGVMIGRGCYGRPWFLAQAAHYLRTGLRLPDPSLASQKSILLRHYQAMLSRFGSGPGVRLARKHLSWYSRGLPGSAEFRATMNRLADAEPVLRLIDRFYDPLIARGVTLSADGRYAAFDSAAPDLVPGTIGGIGRSPQGEPGPSRKLAREYRSGRDFARSSGSYRGLGDEIGRVGISEGSVRFCRYGVELLDRQPLRK